MSPYIAYYANQAGGGTVDRYSDFGRVFVGSPYQRGHGIGAFLGGLFRRILPYLGSAARAVGKEALNAEYIDLAHTMIKVRARILKPDGSAVLEDSVGPVNNFLHSMFNQVDVYFNQKVVTPPNNLYAYRAYIETLLHYGTDAKSSHLGMSLWATDSYGAMDSTAVAAGDARNNNGLVLRQAFTKGGKAFDLLGHLHCDVFNQDKFLMNGVELRVRLIRAKDDFCLMDDSALNYKLRIVEASLIDRRVKLSPGILIAHAKTLAKITAKYPLTRLPKRIILGFVENASFNGSRKKNPFNFQNFGINFLCLNVDGRQVPTKPLQPSFTSGVCLDVEAFNTLFAEQNVNCLLYAEYDNLLEIDCTRQVIVDYSG
ncbi:uncharacterized protein F54H12.2-like [Diachasmimorpha longicaudata]|uniref:uncharacterized protein F54H12.2-like n=1 Tax=Diachasmimorpha longicaudata TaxID=58733 RepID=UPI0030B868EA